MFLNYQQAASFLEDVYHVAIPLDVMARLVEKKLKWKNIDRTVNIRPATDRSKRSVYVRFKSVLSEKAWLNEKKGEAIEAVMFSPFIPLVKDIVFLFLPTLLLVVFWCTVGPGKWIPYLNKVMILRSSGLLFMCWQRR